MQDIRQGAAPAPKRTPSSFSALLLSPRALLRSAQKRHGPSESKSAANGHQSPQDYKKIDAVITSTNKSKTSHGIAINPPGGPQTAHTAEASHKLPNTQPSTAIAASDNRRTEAPASHLLSPTIPRADALQAAQAVSPAGTGGTRFTRYEYYEKALLLSITTTSCQERLSACKVPGRATLLSTQCRRSCLL